MSNEVMTPKQFSANMKMLFKISIEDPESAHAKADTLLVRVLTDLGYGDGCEVFAKMEKWYS